MQNNPENAGVPRKQSFQEFCIPEEFQKNDHHNGLSAVFTLRQVIKVLFSCIIYDKDICTLKSG